MDQVNIEIERKFLVSSLPADIDPGAGIKIRQGYLAFDGDIEIRARAYGDKFVLTAKQGFGLARREYELETNAAQFNALWSFTDGKRLEKVRYIYPYRNVTVEFDVYVGKLASLKVAEVEFDSEQASAGFQVPPFLGEEITLNPAYSNRKLAIHGLPAIHFKK